VAAALLLFMLHALAIVCTKTEFVKSSMTEQNLIGSQLALLFRLSIWSYGSSLHALRQC